MLQGVQLRLRLARYRVEDNAGAIPEGAIVRVSVRSSVGLRVGNWKRARELRRINKAGRDE